MMDNYLILCIILFSTLAWGYLFWRLRQTHATSSTQDGAIMDRLAEIKALYDAQQKTMSTLQHNLNQHFQTQHQALHEQRTTFDAHQQKSMQALQKSFVSSITEIREHVISTLEKHTLSINQKVEKLTVETHQQLQTIGLQVEKNLQQGFEKTTQTFHDIVKRLALIDQAQQKITELSSNVISLQAILADKRARGAFGEVQLASMIGNLLPEQNYKMQQTLSNGKRVDCMLFLPEPTGNLAIDAKFPLESYQNIANGHPSDSHHKSLVSQFKTDIKKHINDIASKYIIEGETADGALMFIPAESIFSEIHAHHPDLVELAQQQRVWITSPTTMMAVLTTARAVIKDSATREQVHLIQHHLTQLAKDFKRFKTRMDQLAKRIHQAYEDVEQVQRSSKKITNRFDQIEQVEFQGLEQSEQLSEEG